MKITKLVPRIVFGSSTFDQLAELLESQFGYGKGYAVFVIDSVHGKTGLRKRLLTQKDDLVFEADIQDHEPTTNQIDDVRDRILSEKKGFPCVIVGIGGGAVMDIAKAVSVMLTNPGSSSQYQGWELVKEKALPKVAVPTLSGTGAESSRTAVLTGPIRKLGINSDQSMFDAVLMDPELLKTVDKTQEFYTGMDCFIHCVEALNGNVINALGRPFAEKAQQAMVDFFTGERNYEKLMVGSFFGGASIANSAVGICHALSYGISLVLGYRHGIANSIVFNQLEEFYGEGVRQFKTMVRINGIDLPKNVTKDVTPEMYEKMINMAYMLEKDLKNALGDNWRKILTPEKIVEIYRRM